MSGDFLSRWSRRKRAARTDLLRRPDETPEAAEAPANLNELPPAASSKDAGVPEATLDETEIARLPSLDELTADSDISGFMRKGVPEGLRNAALRRMWSLDPKIRDYVSEAREYAYDWNTPGGVPGFGGPLPPLEEIQKMAARIVGGLDSGTGPRVDADERQSGESVASQSGESSVSLPTQGTNAVALSQAGDASAAPQSSPVPNALEGLRSDAPQIADHAADPSRDGATTRNDPREQPPNPSRASRHGGAMPV
jgi:hypothetical protein